MNDTYVTYSDYVNDYKGILIPENIFDNYAMQASSIVNYYTFDRCDESNISKNDLIKVTFATCEVADILYKQDQLKSNIDDNESSIASEAVGPHSVSYVNKSNLQSQRILNKKELDKETYSVCLKYLSRTGLMYRGR